MKKKKILSLVLTICMVCTMMPWTAMAQDVNSSVTDTEISQNQGETEVKPEVEPEVKPEVGLDNESVVSGVQINEINFVDTLFREYVSEKFDLDKDGVLSQAEIAKVVNIDVDEELLEKDDDDQDEDDDDQVDNDDEDDDDDDEKENDKVKTSSNPVTTEGIDFKGIEFFTELTELSVEDIQVANLDLSGNRKLKYIQLECDLKEIDLSKNTELVEIDLEENKLSNIDLSNNPNLVYLYVEENELSELDVTKNSKLRILECSDNKLTSLDLSQNAELEELECSDNKLTELNLMNNPKLRELDYDEDLIKNPLVVDPSILDDDDHKSSANSTVPVEQPDVVNPVEPVQPEQGATIGMTYEQNRETQKKMKDVLEDIMDILEDTNMNPEDFQKVIGDAIKNGGKVDFNVIAQSFDEDKAPAEIQQEVAEIKEGLEEIFGKENQQVVQCMDITIDANNQGKDLGKVSSLTKKIPFTVKLPNDAEGNFGIARVHDGVFEKLPARDVTYDKNSQSITFFTDRFSTYAVYKYEGETDVAPENPEQEKPVEPEKPEQPEQEKPVEPEQHNPETVTGVSVKTDYGLAQITFKKNVKANGYKVQYRLAPKGKTPGKWKTVEKKTNKCLIKNLKKNQRYQFRVAPIVENMGRTAYTKPVVKYTNLKGTKPEKMAQQKITKIVNDEDELFIKTNKIIMKNAPKNIVYKFAVREKGSNKWKRATSYNNYYEFSNLKINRTYTISIAYAYKSKIDNKTYVASKYVYKTVKTSSHR